MKLIMLALSNTKIVYYLVLGLLLGIPTWIIESMTAWYIENDVYIIFTLGAILVDWTLGSIYHAFFKRDFSLKKNLLGLIFKVFIVIAVGYLFEGLNELIDKESILKDYTIITLRLMVFLYPAGSAFGNSHEMTNGKFPPMGFMGKLKKFSESATVNSEK